MPIHVKVSGAWSLVKDVFYKQGGVWNLANTVYSRVAGSWVIVHSAEVTAIVTATVTNLNVKNLFSPEDWAHAGKKKRVIINAGIIVGSITATAALLTGTGRGNVLTIVNNGEIQGNGGTANGGAGGPAINIEQTGVTIVNNGAIRGGGGGGGKGGNGGTGGNGYYVNTVTQGPYYQRNVYSWGTGGTVPSADWAGTKVKSKPTGESFSVGSVTYYRGAWADGGGGINWYYISRSYPQNVNTYGGAGGAGGNGGAGQGYTQANTNGAGGAGGGASTGANAGAGGTGGTGGNGGTWGNGGGNGATGNTGGGGNISGGSAGAGGTAGGAAGAAITGSARTVQNNGTINGAT